MTNINQNSYLEDNQKKQIKKQQKTAKKDLKKNIFIPYKIQINLHFFSLKLVYSE